MINNPWHYDPCDKVVLSASMLQCAAMSDDEGDSLIIAGDYGIIEPVAELATRLLPGYCYEGADWDGVAWNEILEDSEPDSLAYWLTLLAANPHITVRELEDEVGKLLVRWLKVNDRTLRSHDLGAGLTA